jgi:hypothetical protein
MGGSCGPSGVDLQDDWTAMRRLPQQKGSSDQGTRTNTKVKKQKNKKKKKQYD